MSKESLKPQTNLKKNQDRLNLQKNGTGIYKCRRRVQGHYIFHGNHYTWENRLWTSQEKNTWQSHIDKAAIKKNTGFLNFNKYQRE